jgi:hypothetical protein
MRLHISEMYKWKCRIWKSYYPKQWLRLNWCHLIVNLKKKSQLRNIMCITREGHVFSSSSLPLKTFKCRGVSFCCFHVCAHTNVLDSPLHHSLLFPLPSPVGVYSPIKIPLLQSETSTSISLAQNSLEIDIYDI